MKDLSLNQTLTALGLTTRQPTAFERELRAILKPCDLHASHISALAASIDALHLRYQTEEYLRGRRDGDRLARESMLPELASDESSERTWTGDAWLHRLEGMSPEEALKRFQWAFVGIKMSEEQERTQDVLQQRFDDARTTA